MKIRDVYRSHRAKQEETLTLTETLRKSARKIDRRSMYQLLLKVDTLGCILCGKMMCFSGLKQGLLLPKLLACHEQLAQMKICGQARAQGRSAGKAERA